MERVNAMSENGTGTVAAASRSRKVGMTRVYDEKGTIVPVTVVQAGPCIVTQVKSEDGKDGYNAIQLGFEEIKERRSTKPLVSHCLQDGTDGAEAVFPRSAADGPSFDALAAGSTVDVTIFDSD